MILARWDGAGWASLSPKRASALHLGLAVLIGAAAFWLVVGGNVLDPRSIQWLAHGDPAQHYLGWSFFRRGPWAWPPAASPDFGLEIASTIFFTDSIPLLALPLKAAGVPALGPWQFHGWWILGCFVLQAVFASLLAGLFVRTMSARALIAALACFAPVFLWRLHGHYSLNGQWILLAALLLCLRPPGRAQGAAWAAVISAGALVHAYLAAMALALWAADIARRLAWPGLGRTPLALEVILAPAVLGAALWLAGFQTLGGGGLAQGAFFGQYGANLLSLVDPSGWSWLLPDIPERFGDYEGFAFLGTGGLLLVGAALVALVRRPPRHVRLAFLPLAIVVAGLAAFGLSHRVALGTRELFVVPLPQRFLDFAEIFRASGRMVWPLHYLLLLGAAIVVARRLPGRVGAAVLALALALQVADTAAAWRPIGQKLREPGETWRTPMQNPFWSEAGSLYRTLRLIPTQVHAPNWLHLSYFALTHGLRTDAVFLARVSNARFWDLRNAGNGMLASGAFDADTLYILDDAAARQAVATVDAGRDLLARIDGFNVLAPGWLARRAAPAGAEMLTPDSMLPLLTPEQPLHFSPGTQGVWALDGGWSSPEPFGVWSIGNQARLSVRVPAPAAGAVVLRFDVRALLTPRLPRQRVALHAGGDLVAEWLLTAENNERPREVRFPAGALRPLGDGTAVLQIALDLPDAVRPKDIGLNDDTRMLGVAAFALELVGH